MEKSQIENIINYALTKSIEYAELYFEKTDNFVMGISKDKLEQSRSNQTNGIGIRLYKDEIIAYQSTSLINEDNLKKTIDKMSEIYQIQERKSNFKLKTLKKAKKKSNITYLENYSKEKIKEFLKEQSIFAKSLDSRIKNVDISFKYHLKEITIANSEGNYTNEERIISEIMISLIMEEKGVTVSSGKRVYLMGGLEIFEDFNAKKVFNQILKTGRNKLKAVNLKGGLMPVILEKGAGAIFFHEAVGHSLEAEFISRKQSTFEGLIGQKVASELVTLIDDGHRKNLFGSTYFDDEGSRTQKNILIENGILKSYLVDKINGLKLNIPSTSSSRRESYYYNPTSRMNNTYLAKGKDKVKDMIKSIDYGIYVYSINGGQVNPISGDFTFGVASARLIEKGKLTKYIKEITLIGKCNEMLHKVEMVGNDFSFKDGGICGASSGGVPVESGQPTIKLSEILVGGKED